MPRSSIPKLSPAKALEAVDAGFKEAELVRSPRRATVRRVRQSQPETAEKEDLTRPAPMPQRATNGVEWLAVPGWDFSWLWAGFSTRIGGTSRAYCPEDAPGELNLGFTAADDRNLVLQNRRRLAEAISGNANIQLVTLKQFHSNLIVQATGADASREQPRRGDGLLTDEPELLLAIQTADCIPVLVADRQKQAVAAFHAGWRGTVKRIVELGVGRMRLAFGSRPEDLVAAIGPGIGPCCYAVGEEVFSEFESQFTYAPDLFHEVFDSDAVRTKYPMLFLTQRAPGHSNIGPSSHVDLIEANRRQLLAAGLSPESIQVIGGCTQCRQDLFYSHRASRGHAGRMMAVIGIKTRQAR
jgi:polyphenol oxidase